MQLLIPLGQIFAGFFLLIKSADWLVSGASSIAKRLKVPDLVIGLTIVSFGTSMPELLVNVFASLSGNADIAIGNIVGSNISNTLLILGVTATITPLAVKQNTVMKEIPFSLLAAVVLLIMVNDRLIDHYGESVLSAGDGAVLLCFFLIFLYYTFGIRADDATDTFTEATTKVWIALSKIAISLVGLTIGGEITVRGASDTAALFGLSQALIGLTVVAIGTSLPELVTSVVAAMKGNADISIGNVVGSNIFNILWILGISAVIHPIPFSTAINADLVVVIACTIILFFFTHTGALHKRLLFWQQRRGHVITRTEGIFMACCYVAYLSFVAIRG